MVLPVAPPIVAQITFLTVSGITINSYIMHCQKKNRAGSVCTQQRVYVYAQSRTVCSFQIKYDEHGVRT